MTCLNCGVSLKLHRSQSTRKKEVWGCPRKGCTFREVFPLWGDMRVIPGPDVPRKHTVYCDKRPLAVWFWNDEMEQGKEVTVGG